MGKCSVCNHPQRTEIDTALLTKAKLRTLAAAFGLTHISLHRHRTNHLSRAVAKVQKAQELITGKSTALAIAEQLKPFQDRLETIAKLCETVSHGPTLAALAREARANIEMRLKLLEAPGFRQPPAQQTRVEVRADKALILPIAPSAPALPAAPDDGAAEERY